jgi:hypothetical protein
MFVSSQKASEEGKGSYKPSVSQVRSAVHAPDTFVGRMALYRHLPGNEQKDYSDEVSEGAGAIQGIRNAAQKLSSSLTGSVIEDHNGTVAPLPSSERDELLASLVFTVPPCVTSDDGKSSSTPTRLCLPLTRTVTESHGRFKVMQRRESKTLTVGKVVLSLRWMPIRSGLEHRVTLRTTCSLDGIGVSLVDGKPQELTYLTLQSLQLSYTAFADSRQIIEFTLAHLQMDNQLSNSMYPVMLAPRVAHVGVAADAMIAESAEGLCT